jgi:inosose dehydratase
MSETIRLATNSFSWLAQYNQDQTEKTAERIVAEAAQAGAEGLEIGPERVSTEMLARYGIALSGASTGGDLFGEWTAADTAGIVATARAAAALGADYLFFTCAPKGGWGQQQEATDEDLRRVGSRLDDLGKQVRTVGLRFGLHNHAAFLAGLDAELRLIREFTDPAWVDLYLDLGWAATAGGDPVALIYEFGPRLGGLHFRNQRGAVPTQTLAEGDLDLPAAVSALRAVGYAGWASLELWHRHDTVVTKSMLECQQESLAYLRELLGGSA